MTTLKGYRTLIFNLAMGVLLAIRGFYPDAELPDAPAVEAAIGAFLDSLEVLIVLGNVILRALTTTPIGKKEAP